MSTPNRTGQGKSSGYQPQNPNPAPHNPSSPQNMDFVMMAIMDMKKELGCISSELKSLPKIESRLDRIEDSISTISKHLYAAWVVIGISIVVGGFFIDKVWDVAADHIVISTKNDNPSSPSASPLPQLKK